MTSAPGAPLACPAAALSSGWRLWLGPPSAAFGRRMCHPPPQARCQGDGDWAGHVRPAPSLGKARLRMGVEERAHSTAVPVARGQRGQIPTSSLSYRQSPATCGDGAPEMWPAQLRNPSLHFDLILPN